MARAETEEETVQLIVCDEENLADEAKVQAWLRRKDEAVRTSRAGTIVVDLTRARVVKSGALRGLIQWRRATLERGAAFIVAGLNDRTALVFHVTRLDRVFTLVPTVRDVPGLFSE